MTNTIEPDEAHAALVEIRRRQDQVIEGTLVPTWYWWAVALPTVGLGVVVDTHEAVAIGVAALLYGVGVALLTGWVIVGGVRGVRVHDVLLGPLGAGLIVGFVGLLVGGTIALAFLLEAGGWRYPATASMLVCAVALVVGGPILMRRLRVLMQRQQGGRTR